ncbi:hypothetical protein DXG01_008790 [Tephrocybe rancida]|nr:hypothetical protein DXG01_008790 [Tephrocybe rancida]
MTSDATEKGEEIDSASAKNLSIGEIEKTYPLHFAIVNTKGQQVVDTIRRIHQADPVSIHAPDAYGFTPIHTALSKANPDAVRVLLELGVTDDLKNAANSKGTTPLEGLTSAMESSREFAEVHLIQGWSGHGNDELACEFLMKRAMGESTMSNTIEGYIAKRKWDSGAQEAVEMMDTTMLMNCFENRIPLRNTKSLMDCVSDYIPENLYPSFYKTFYVGYQSIFHVIDVFLAQTDFPLSVKAVTEIAIKQNGVDFYFGKGGKVEYAFDALTDGAKAQSPLGDGYFDWIFEEVEVYTSLPVCSNDLKFDLVRQRLGLTRDVCWGPYNDSLLNTTLFVPKDNEGDSDEMDIDSEEDDDSEEKKGEWTTGLPGFEDLMRHMVAAGVFKRQQV